MRRTEEGLLMLTCALSQSVVPLTGAEYRLLMQRLSTTPMPPQEGEVTAEFLRSLGYSPAGAQRIIRLLERDDALKAYLSLPDLSVVTHLDTHFPQRLRHLKHHCPTALFCRGDVSLLSTPCISLVGSRRLPLRSKRFAQRIGTMAAQEGFTLVSGGAEGADLAAQNACLAAGGSVICFVPDALSRRRVQKNTLFCSDEGWDFAFSAARALRRNCYIHALGEKVIVAHCEHPHGGTWSGTSYNLQHRLSPVFLLDTDTEGSRVLGAMGGVFIDESIASLADLLPSQLSIFD